MESERKITFLEFGVLYVKVTPVLLSVCDTQKVRLAPRGITEAQYETLSLDVAGQFQFIAVLIGQKPR
jgi:hypothetical protein